MERDELLRELIQAFNANKGIITRDNACGAMKKLEEIKFLLAISLRMATLLQKRVDCGPPKQACIN